MASGLEGRRNLTAPTAWKETVAQLSQSKNSEVKQLTSRLNQIFGDQEATEKAFATVRDPKANADQRRAALVDHAKAATTETGVGKTTQ
jgi:hypothetical protein